MAYFDQVERGAYGSENVPALMSPITPRGVRAARPDPRIVSRNYGVRGGGVRTDPAAPGGGTSAPPASPGPQPPWVGGGVAQPGWYSGGGYFAGGPPQQAPPPTGGLQFPSPRSPGYNQNIGPANIAFGPGVNPNANYGQSWQNYTNPYDMMYNQWLGTQFGPQQQAIWNQVGSNLDTYGRNYQRYTDLADASYSPEHYGRNAYYTPDEINDMTRQSQFMAGMTTPDEFAATYFSPEEQARISGDPYAGLNYFNDRAGRQFSDLDTQEGRTFDALSSMDDRLDRYGDQYEQTGRGALDSGAGRMRSLTGSDALNLDPEFARNYKFGQSDVNDLENLAGTTAGNQIRSQAESIDRRAAAQGNTSPMALAAMKQRFANDAASQAADAATGARVQGRGLQLSTMANKEGMRLDAERGKTDRQTDAERTIMANELGYGSSLAGLRSGNTQFGSNARLSAYDQLGKLRQNANQFTAGMGGQFAAQGDTNASNRAAGIAGQRTSTQANNNTVRYGQNYDTQRQLASAANNIANQRLGANQEQRGYWAGQAASNSGAQQNATNTASNWWSNWNNAGQNASNSYGSYDLNRRTQQLAQQQAMWGRGMTGGYFNPGG